MKIPVFVLFGPTASGKTALLEELFQKEASKMEIISADSMQVYRGMDIGTAKPSLSERAAVPHHLIDIRDPNEQFNAGEFVRLAEEACLAASSRGALPVVSGGTGFYLKNLVFGLPEAPPSDETLRIELKEELKQSGGALLMEDLAKVDPVSAKRIHVNDEYRLLRALEVYRLSGRPLSSYDSPWNSMQGNEVQGKSWNKKIEERPFRYLIIGLRREREELYRRINERTNAMFNAGLAEEVRRLYESGYTPVDPGLRAIGYREFFIEELCAAENLSSSRNWQLSEDIHGVKALVAQNSRRYAKRQITFFSSLPDVKWVECKGEGEGDAVREVSEVLVKFLRE